VWVVMLMMMIEIMMFMVERRVVGVSDVCIVD